MKEILSIVLSWALVFSTSCSVQKKSSDSKPAPTTPATEQQIDDTEQKMSEQGDQQDFGKEGEGVRYSQSRAYLDATVTKLMAANDMFIKNHNGDDIDLATYKQNPSQYFVLADNAAAEGFFALKSAVDEANLSRDSDSITMDFEVFTVSGSMDAFAGADLGEPVFEDSLTLYTSALKSLQNKKNVEAFLTRIDSSEELAANNASLLDSVKSFLFPTAYADYERNLLITAIVFTSVAVLSYIFALYTIGDISTAVSIVFWLLYAFERNR